jgi:hypothetical protein
MKYFFELNLGSMNMDEYENKFFKFFKYVDFIKDVKVKIQRFLLILRGGWISIKYNLKPFSNYT